MASHASQPKELNASADIAPYGWNPAAVKGIASSLHVNRILTTLIDQQGRHYTKWITIRNGDLSLSHLNSIGNTGWPKLAGSDLVRSVPIWSRSPNSTQGRLVMSSAAGIQSGLSTTYKSEVTKTKAVNREVGKWEKGEVGQHLNLLTNLMKEDVCPATT